MSNIESSKTSQGTGLFSMVIIFSCLRDPHSIFYVLENIVGLVVHHIVGVIQVVQLFFLQLPASYITHHNIAHSATT